MQHTDAHASPGRYRFTVADTEEGPAGLGRGLAGSLSLSASFCTSWFRELTSSHPEIYAPGLHMLPAPELAARASDICV